jgi:hypothetical protein
MDFPPGKDLEMGSLSNPRQPGGIWVARAAGMHSALSTVSTEPRRLGDG